MTILSCLGMPECFKIFSGTLVQIVDIVFDQDFGEIPLFHLAHVSSLSQGQLACFI